MEKNKILKIIQGQKDFFTSGNTKAIDFRIDKLNRLKNSIIKNEKNITEALYKDFKKSPTEVYTSEIGSLIEEINFTIKHLRKWASPKKKRTPLVLFSSSSYTIKEPYGICLLIGAWNYPFALSLEPLIGSIAGGNCAIIKPSELAIHSSRVISKIIKETFNENYISVIEGGAETATTILEQRFDYIFYTGGVLVGKIVSKAAAKNLTPTTLELGGKSPCIVEDYSSLNVVAKRIVWGKFINAGQTCIAPDYILVNEEIKPQLILALKKTIKKFYTEDPEKSNDYPRIVNERHFERLEKLLQGDVIFGGNRNKKNLYISPTIIDNVLWKSEIMKEEIFGPILPIISYTSFSEIIREINYREKPLAIYLFSENKKYQEIVKNNTSSGSIGINTTILQTTNPYLPFGGVGNSGMGNYHGKYSFDTFTHEKAIMEKSIWPELDISYPPYKNKLFFLRRIWGRK